MTFKILHLDKFKVATCVFARAGVSVYSCCVHLRDEYLSIQIAIANAVLSMDNNNRLKCTGTLSKREHENRKKRTQSTKYFIYVCYAAVAVAHTK